MISIDAVRLARRQLGLDRDRTARFNDLFAHKVERMTASPLAFLRGSAPLFYELLDRHRILSEGPPGEGWLVGDAHLENFGAYRTGALSTRASKERRDAERVVFDLNDFDDAIVGPWRFDVLRLLTSLLLGGRELGADGRRALALCDALMDTYTGALFRRQPPPAPPRVITSLVDRVCARTGKQLLEARTTLVRGKRRFVRGPRYRDLPIKIRAKVERAFAKYVKKLPAADRPPEDALEIIDAAFRVAGTGSLGSLRIAVLVTGKGGEDGAWIFDLKEEGIPSAACVLRAPDLEPAERVKAAFEACLPQTPRMIGTTRLRGSSMFARRLAPQEDKLDLTTIASEDLEPLARHLGALLGAAHRRGAHRMPKKQWSAEGRACLLGNAITLAGTHEATYLAYCGLVRR